MTAPAEPSDQHIGSARCRRSTPFESCSASSTPPIFLCKERSFGLVGHRMRLSLPSLFIHFSSAVGGSGKIWFSRIIDFSSSSSIHLSILRRHSLLARLVRSFVPSFLVAVLFSFYSIHSNGSLPENGVSKDCGDGERKDGRIGRRKWDSLAFSLPFCKALLLAGGLPGWLAGWAGGRHG